MISVDIGALRNPNRITLCSNKYFLPSPSSITVLSSHLFAKITRPDNYHLLFHSLPCQDFQLAECLHECLPEIKTSAESVSHFSAYFHMRFSLYTCQTVHHRPNTSPRHLSAIFTPCNLITSPLYSYTSCNISAFCWRTKEQLDPYLASRLPLCF